MKYLLGFCLLLMLVLPASADKLNFANVPALHQREAYRAQRYVLENQYILLCDYLSNTNTHAILGTDELVQLLVPLYATDKDKEIKLTQYLSGLQVELVLAADTRWWYSCQWHTEPWAVQTATANLAALFGQFMITDIPDTPLPPRGRKHLGFRIVDNVKK